MAAARETGPALQRLAGSLGSDIDAHLNWLHATLGRLQERLDQAVAEQAPEWTQQRLADMLTRLRHAESQLLQAQDRLSLPPLMHIAASDASDVRGLLQRLLPHALIGRVLDEAAPRQSAPVLVNAGSHASLRLALFRGDTVPSQADWPSGADPEHLPAALELANPGTEGDWPQLLAWPEQDTSDSLRHDTRAILELHSDAHSGGDHASRRDLSCFLQRAWLDVPDAPPYLHDARVLLGLDWRAQVQSGPVGAAFQQIKHEQLLRQEIAELDGLWLVTEAGGDASDPQSDRFSRLLWQPWCNRCGVEADPRGFTGRLGLLVVHAERLFTMSERASGDWLLRAEDHPLHLLQRHLFDHLLGFRDRGPESWPALVLLSEQPPLQVAGMERDEIFRVLSDYFRAHSDAPVDAHADWPAHWRSLWRCCQGLWSLPAFREQAPRRGRSWRRLLRALIACCDPDDAGLGRHQYLLQRWWQHGPMRHAALTTSTRLLDHVRQMVQELQQELTPRALREFDVDRIQKAQLFLRDTGAYAPETLGFRFATRDCQGLTDLRQRIIAQEGVQLADVLTAVTADALAQLPIPEDMPPETADSGRTLLLETVRELIGLDRCWQDFSREYIGPKDITLSTLIEASQLILQRLNAVLEWLTDLADDSQAEEALQHGVSPAAALDRLLTDLGLPESPSSQVATIDRELQDLILAVYQSADEE